MHNLDQSVSNGLETLAAWDRCFSVREAVWWLDDEVDADTVKQGILGDGRFLSLGRSGWGTEHFLPIRAALRWWCGLNIKLAHIQVSELSKSQLAQNINSLYKYPLWHAPPTVLIELGQRFGLVSVSWKPDRYVFPVAHILRFLNSSLRMDTEELLEVCCAPRNKPANSQLNLFKRASVVEAVEAQLESAGPKICHIIKSREGIPPYKRATLEELGVAYGVTRERIRQLESKFWRGRRHPRQRGNLKQLGLSLIQLVIEHRSLVFDMAWEDTPHLCLAAKYFGVPYVSTMVGNLLVVGADDFDWHPVRGIGLNDGEAAIEEVAKLLQPKLLEFLERNAVLKICQALLSDARGRLTKQEKVYLALRQFCRSAHYTEVTKEYSRMYPGDEMSEHNIHATLSRCAAPDLEQYGIVWVGAKGTYGLKEHGFKRPDLSLFDTVTKIVQEKYAASRKPVHVSVIIAELGRYRQVVNSASIAFATGANTDLHQVDQDYFVPKDGQAELGTGGDANELDRVLREFKEAQSTQERRNGASY